MTDPRGRGHAATISPVPERVRVSFLSSRTQVDVSLPLDVPIAGLTPELVKVARLRDGVNTDSLDEPAEARHDVWVLTRHDGTAALPADRTLRQAGVAEGELLRLTAERALCAPTLYDDVVDAAARLNKTGSAAWDWRAARVMTFAGVYLGTAVWVYFLLSPMFAPHRAVLLGLAVVTALMLAGTAALAYRSHHQSDVGAALGWATLPVAAAVGWLALRGWGGYALASGCTALVLLAGALFRVIGTGHWGYLSAGVISGFAALALAAHTAGAGIGVTASLLAVFTTLGCRLVPRLPVRFARAARRRRGTEGDGGPGAVDEQDVWSRSRSETLTRSALYTGLAVTAALGVAVVLTARGTPAWSDLAFAWTCAAALGCYVQRPGTALERAGLAVPAGGLAALSCIVAQCGSRLQSLAGWVIVLTLIAGLSVLGIRAHPGSQRLKTMLDYSTYLLTAALILLALWVIGAYDRLSGA